MLEIIGGIAVLTGCAIVWGLILAVEAREDAKRRKAEETEAVIRGFHDHHTSR